MQFNSQSWFFKKYLRSRYYPKTVCELVNQTIWSTLVYLWYAGIAIALIACPIVTLLEMLEWIQVSGTYFSKVNMAFAFIVTAVEAFVLLFLFTVYFVVDKILVPSASWFDRKFNYRPDLDEPKQPSRITEYYKTVKYLIKAIYARVKDKTCVIIEYK